jgi:hypothetical protein
MPIENPRERWRDQPGDMRGRPALAQQIQDRQRMHHIAQGGGFDDQNLLGIQVGSAECLFVDFATMSNTRDKNLLRGVVDSVYDAPVPHPESIVSTPFALELLDVGMPMRMMFQMFKTPR